MSKVTTFEYDELNRITKKNYPADPDVTYLYDIGKIGTLTQVIDSSGTVHYYYDNRLRKIKEEFTADSKTWSSEWTYDALDRPITQKYPDSETVTMTYNNQGELETLSNVLTNLDYNEFNKITKKEYNNGISTTLTYDQNNFRLSSIHTTGIQDLNYRFDCAGNVISVTDSIASKTQNFLLCI